MNSLERKLKLAVLLIVSVVFFTFACKGNGNKPESESKDPKLELVSIFVSDVRVENGRVTVSDEELRYKDVTAIFNYGKIKNKAIDVQIKDEPFVVDKTSEKTLHLSIKAKPGIYQGWSTDVVVSYEKREVYEDMVTFLSISTGKDKGKDILANKEDIEKILLGKNIHLSLKGAKVKLTIGSEKITWDSLIINNEPFTFQPKVQGGKRFLSYAVAYVDLLDISNSKTISIKVDGMNKTSTYLFNVTRLEGTVDIPDLGLLVDEKYMIEKDTLQGLANNGALEFMAGGEPSKIGVRCWHDEMQSVKVNGNDAPITERESTLPGGKVTTYLAESHVKEIGEDGKDVEVIIEPKDKTKYHTVTWHFKIKKEPIKPVPVLYTFNRKKMQELGSDFIQQIENGGNPLLNFEGTSLNMELNYLEAKLEKIQINDTSITGDALNWDGGFGGVVFHSVKVGDQETQITITFVPEDKNKYTTSVMKFKAKGNGEKEKITSRLSIGEYTLPTSFTDHLTDGKKPTFKVAESKADIKISLDEYTFKCLCDKIKVTVDSNVETIDIKAKKVSFTVTHYEASKEIDVSSPKEIKVEFIPKDVDIAQGDALQFKLETGGTKPIFPSDKIYAFTINKKGTYNNPLPSKVADHLLDASLPSYTIDSDKASVVIFWRSTVNDLIEKVIFKMDDVKVFESAPEQLDTFMGVRHVFSLTDPLPKEYKIEVEIVPADKNKYSSLIYSLKLSNSGLQEAIPCQFGYNNQLVENTNETTLQGELVEVFVQSYQNVMQSVTIEGNAVDIKKIEYKPGKFAYKATADVLLPSDSFKDVKISVTPLSGLNFRVTECTYKLKGTKIAQNNAEFQYIGGKQKIISDIEWQDGKIHQYSDDYGAKTLILKAYTLSPRAKVYYKGIGYTYKIEGGVQTKEEVTLIPQTMLTSNSKGFHISSKITLYNDKPTIIKIWVVAENGALDSERGEKTIKYNPISLKWGYDKKDKGQDFTFEGYDKIKVDRSKLVDNKIYIAFSMWSETFGYKIKDPSFKKLNVEDNNQWYVKEVDASSLTPSSPLTVSLPVYQDKGKFLSFTYKVQIEE